MNPEQKYSQFLSSLKGIEGNFVQKIKIKYRPFICPFDFIVREAKGVDSVFDIGCGNGQLLYILDRFSGDLPKKLMGIEISDSLVKQAANIIKNNQFLNSIIVEKYDGIILPDTLSNYSMITMIDVLHHIPASRQKDILHQLFLKSKKGALLLLKDIDASSPLVFFNKLHDKILSGEIGREISMQMAMKWLEDYGFKILKTFRHTTLWYPHYYILFEKP